MAEGMAPGKVSVALGGVSLLLEVEMAALRWSERQVH
jgi:hypothetical protein